MLHPDKTKVDFTISCDVCGAVITSRDLVVLTALYGDDIPWSAEVGSDGVRRHWYSDTCRDEYAPDVSAEEREAVLTKLRSLPDVPEDDFDPDDV